MNSVKLPSDNDEKKSLGKNRSFPGYHMKRKSLSVDWYNVVASHVETIDSKTKAQIIEDLCPHHKVDLDFVTGSVYSGVYNRLGMTQRGHYTFQTGCEYEGGFEDGMFHGEGTMTYPLGQKLEGLWEKGKMVAYKFANTDGLEYESNWKYCIMPDRRFNISIREGLQPAGREFMTNQQPERPIEPGCYDTGDGFYNPKTKSIIPVREVEPLGSLDSGSTLFEKMDEQFWMNAIIMVSEPRHEWIVANCRKSWDEPAGYRPDLYEAWISGRRKELEELDEIYMPESPSLDVAEDEEETKTATNPTDDSDEKESMVYAGTGRKLQPSVSIIE